MNKFRTKRLTKKLAKAEMKLADIKHHKAAWIDGWSHAPSKHRAAEVLVARAQTKVNKLQHKLGL